MTFRNRPRSWRREAGVAIAMLVLLGPEDVRSQVSATNLIEGQNGNIPFAEPENRLAVYDQLNLHWQRDRLRLGLRFETERTSQGEYDYAAITQRFAEWDGDDLLVRVGTLYTILGRGLVHRSFELPGVVLDQPGLRSRYAPSRDVDGVLIEYAGGPVRGLAFTGTPGDGTVSPGLEDLGLSRYAGQLSGAEVRVRARADAEAGATYARSQVSGGIPTELGSGFLEFDPAALIGQGAVQLPLYVEYAQAGRTFGDWWSLHTGDGVPHALYAGGNLIWRRFALSAEWKDYSAFRFGTNDPPSLVREHGWALLNRATHVLDAADEEGYQLEATWTGPDWATLTLNSSRSDGAQARRRVRFEERFAEVHLAPTRSAWEAAAYYDEGKDEFAFVEDRSGAGLSTTIRLTAPVSVSGAVERQRTRRTDASFTDHRATLSVSWAGVGSGSFIWERTDDPAEEDPDDAISPPVQARNFLGVAFSARLSPEHELAVFAGERRGGRACTAGTCYEVLAFKGVETRLTSRF